MATSTILANAKSTAKMVNVSHLSNEDINKELKAMNSMATDLVKAIDNASTKLAIDLELLKNGKAYKEYANRKTGHCLTSFGTACLKAIAAMESQASVLSGKGTKFTAYRTSLKNVLAVLSYTSCFKVGINNQGLTVEKGTEEPKAATWEKAIELYMADKEKVSREKAAINEMKKASEKAATVEVTQEVAQLVQEKATLQSKQSEALTKISSLEATEERLESVIEQDKVTIASLQAEVEAYKALIAQIQAAKSIAEVRKALAA